MFVYRCTHVCTRMWRPEVNVRHLFQSFSTLFLKFVIFIHFAGGWAHAMASMCVCVKVMPWQARVDTLRSCHGKQACVHKGQRTTGWNQFSPSTTWVLRSNPGRQGWQQELRHTETSCEPSTSFLRQGHLLKLKLTTDWLGCLVQGSICLSLCPTPTLSTKSTDKSCTWFFPEC